MTKTFTFPFRQARDVDDAPPLEEDSSYLWLVTFDKPTSEDQMSITFRRTTHCVYQVSSSLLNKLSVTTATNSNGIADHMGAFYNYLDSMGTVLQEHDVDKKSGTTLLITASNLAMLAKRC
jgi:hypothetical protein